MPRPAGTRAGRPRLRPEHEWHDRPRSGALGLRARSPSSATTRPGAAASPRSPPILPRPWRKQAPETAFWTVAMNDVPGGYAYPQQVRFELDESSLTDYRLAAEFLNMNQVDVACLQHEYGIFGGADGRYILRLVGELRMPVVTTLHTVLQDPTPGQKETLQQAGRSFRSTGRLEPHGRRFPARTSTTSREEKIVLHPPRHPRRPVRRPELLQGPVRGGRTAGHPHLRAALAQQGHRAHGAGTAGDRRTAIPILSTSCWASPTRTSCGTTGSPTGSRCSSWPRRSAWPATSSSRTASSTTRS